MSDQPPDPRPPRAEVIPFSATADAGIEDTAPVEDYAREQPAAEILKFRPKAAKYGPEWEQSYKEALEALERSSIELIENVVGLAAKGPWAKWNEGKPIGSTLVIPGDNLVDALSDSDARLGKLGRLWAEIDQVLDELRKGAP